MTKLPIQILILEDDFLTIAALYKAFDKVGLNVSPVVLSDYLQVEKLINNSDYTFDVILLDRDCSLGGSFHVLNIEKFGIDKVIGISSTPDWNEELRKRGVTKLIHKDFQNIDRFADQVVTLVKMMIDQNTPAKS